MYKHVYNTMVELKVAIKLDIPLLHDVHGNEVASKEAVYGLPTQFVITNPKNIIFVDEMGENTNMKDNKRI